MSCCSSFAVETNLAIATRRIQSHKSAKGPEIATRSITNNLFWDRRIAIFRCWINDLAHPRFHRNLRVHMATGQHGCHENEVVATCSRAYLSAIDASLGSNRILVESLPTSPFKT